MADASSPAGRINRALGALFAVIVVCSLIVAVAVDPGAPSAGTSTTTAPSDPSIVGLRPAETSLSWFDHGMGVEQFDYEMPDLSCEAVADSITPDLCAIATSPNGDFMLIGNEGFWDPSETARDGLAYVPLNLTIFTMREDQGTPRAISVLDGATEHPYMEVPVRVNVRKVTINGSEVLIIHKHIADPDADAYSSWDEVQVVAASSTGAPTVVATYRGARLSVAASDSAVFLSSLRYKASGSSDGTEWFSRVTLTPTSDPGTWSETVTSTSESVVDGEGSVLLDSYDFPALGGRTNNSKA